MDADIDMHLAWIFGKEVVAQWEHIQRTHKMINDALREQRGDYLWVAIEGNLSAVARISKIFWPSGKPKADVVARCEGLRDLYGIAEPTHPPIMRGVRNGLEHLDERVDVWARTSLRRNFANYIVAPVSQFVGIDLSDTARRFDPETSEVVVFGESVLLTGLWEVTGGIVGKVVAKLPSVEAEWLAQVSQENDR